MLPVYQIVAHRVGPFFVAPIQPPDTFGNIHTHVRPPGQLVIEAMVGVAGTDFGGTVLPEEVVAALVVNGPVGIP